MVVMGLVAAHPLLTPMMLEVGHIRNPKTIPRLYPFSSVRQV